MNTDSFPRWQDRTIEQLGYTSNLIMGLAGGILAITITILRDDKQLLACCDILLLRLYSCCLFLSVATGLVLAVNRLQDFKLTSQIARDRTRSKRKYTQQEIDDMRDASGAHGEWTWRLFNVQLMLFAIGAAFYVYFLWRVLPQSAHAGT